MGRNGGYWSRLADTPWRNSAKSFTPVSSGTDWFAAKGGITLDEGAVILQKKTPIGPDDTLGSVYFDRLFPMGVEAMLESVDLVKAGNLFFTSGVRGVNRKTGDALETEVVVGGPLSDRKGVNVPDVVLPLGQPVHDVTAFAGSPAALNQPTRQMLHPEPVAE